MSSLPDSCSPDIVLATPTDAERTQIWTACYAASAGDSTLDQFIKRQRSYTQTTQLALSGDVSPWVLTTSAGSEPRPLLSACDTVRKRALYRDPSTGIVKDVSAHGLSTVFTPIETRRRGYAGLMARMVSQSFAQQHKTKPEVAQFGFLYSGIDPAFYAQNGGWRAVPEKTHLEFDVAEGSVFAADMAAKDITDEMLPALAARDEELLREQLATPNADKIRIAFCPDVATLDYIYAREDRVMAQFVGKAPTVRGAVYGEDGARVWALWMRFRYPAGEDGSPVKYRLHFLRLVVEDRSRMSEEELVKGLRGVFAVALREAKAWNCETVDTWNPSAEISELVQTKLPELGARYGRRQPGDAACLLWFDSDVDVEDIDWVANERYAWC